MGGIVLFMRNNSKTESFGHFITQSSTLKKKKKSKPQPPSPFSLPGTETGHYRVLSPRCIFFSFWSKRSPKQTPTDSAYKGTVYRHCLLESVNQQVTQPGDSS